MRATMKDVRFYLDLCNDEIGRLGCGVQLRIHSESGIKRIATTNERDIGYHGTTTELYKELNLLYDVLHIIRNSKEEPC